MQAGTQLETLLPVNLTVQSLGQPSFQGMSESFFFSASLFFIDIASVLPIMESHGTHDTGFLNYLNHDIAPPTVAPSRHSGS
ncbi:hypothetical protein CROQUDRAFT_658161 [Cronartium quercuum f. sp. fusiforme G11]|uniref:Uncharacterized protein n=1 Tax=Cronartium quercuum f. sp. fusiforme G11 TaxID=708437 RepID=A0A9P6NH47_9BASI|nr:hypothetical protein CROQUDRAFT_658161 [Cronartium quercuum f. sp. fusiforme G11]